MIALNSYDLSISSSDEETKILTSSILRHASVEAVFLLGSAKSQKRTSTIFFNDPLTPSYTSRYYILVLIKKSKEYTLNSIQDKIENNLLHFIPTTAIVLTTDMFFDWINKGHSFAVNVLKKGEKLYQNDHLIFPLPSAINEEELKEANEQLLRLTQQKTDSFLAGAELYRARREYKFSAFMLHQAAEQILRAMLIIHTGLKINTHSIDKLIRYCSMFCPQLQDVFRLNNEKEKKLYLLLNKAYIHTRYKDDYTISYEELIALTGKIQALKHTLKTARF